MSGLRARRGILLLAAAAWLSAPPARGAEPPPPPPAGEAPAKPEPTAAGLLAKGKRLLGEGKPAAAYAALHEAFLKSPGSVEINYHLGRAAFEAGMYEEAATAYDRVLTSNPSLHRVRFELARSYYGLGYHAGALEEFERVLKDLPADKPSLRRTVELQIARCRFRLGQYAEAKRDLERLIAELPEERAAERAMAEEYLLACRRFLRRSFMSGKLAFAGVYDSNATVAPEPDTVDTVFGRVVLDPGAREEEDFFFSTLLTLSHTGVMDPDMGLAWRTGLTAYGTRYADEKEQDITYLRAATGPSLSRPLSRGSPPAGSGRADLHLGLSPFIVHMSRDDEDYLEAWGLELNGSCALAWPRRSLVVGTGAKLERREIEPDPDRDADNIEVRLFSRLQWGPAAKNEASVVLSWERELAKAADESYVAGAFSLGYRRKLPWDLEASVGYSFRSSQYDQTNPLFDEEREDDQHRFSVGLSRKIPWWGLSADAFCQHTISDSKVDLYEYDRTLLGIGLSKEF